MWLMLFAEICEPKAYNHEVGSWRWSQSFGTRFSLLQLPVLSEQM